MKKSYIILALVMIGSVFFSCREQYDDFDDQTDIVIGFTRPFATFTIPPGESLEKEVGFFVSTVSDTDRTFQVVVDSENSQVTSENYSFNSTATVLANETTGTMVVTGINVSLGPEFEDLTLMFESNTGVVSGGKASLKLKSSN